ncbi:MAG: MarR family winged helix-turn-helix transcriptional regulator [Verrucomicrobiales bacterium]
MATKTNSHSDSDSDLLLPIDSPGLKRLPPLLRRAWYGLNQAFRRRISHTKVTPDQFTVMRTLKEGDPKGMTQNEIAEVMSSDPNTIASLIERMEANGLVDRQEHESDRRAHRILLRQQGAAIYSTIRDIAISLQTEALASLPEDQRGQFLRNLELVADACRIAADRSPKKARAKAARKEKQ